MRQWRTPRSKQRPCGHAVPCRDHTGRRCTLTVATDGDRVVISAPQGKRVTLTPLQAGRLRAALRAAALGADGG